MASPGPWYIDHMGRCSISMLNTFPIAVLAGLLLGFLAGLGVGGGSLLILWLTVVLGMPHQTARAINLMFFITAAGAVSVFRWRRGNLKIKAILPAIIAGCIAAAGFTFLREWINTGIAKKLFGGLLIVTGIRELLYRPRNAK